MSTRFGFHDSLAVIRIRDFRYFVASRFFATLATQMMALVISWQIYQMTKDPLALGLIGLVEAVVFISFALFAGHTADRREKRAIILSMQALLLISALILMNLTRMGSATLLRIYGVIAVTGLARSFLWPASFAFSEMTVPREIYSRAAAWNSSSWEIATIAGPAVGGAIYAWKGAVTAYETVAVLMAVAFLLALRLGKKPPPEVEVGEGASDLLAGIRFVRSRRVILGALSLDMFAVLFGGPIALLPIFADRLGVGPRGLGWLRAAPSLGAICMAIYQSYRPPFERAGRALLTAVSLFGLAIIGFALSHVFWLSMVLLAFGGMVDNISVVMRHSILQANVPDPMRGRVSSVNGVFIGSSNEIGAFESGLAARLIGTVPSVVFGGAMTLVTVAVAAWKFPELRKLGAVHKPVS